MQPKAQRTALTYRQVRPAFSSEISCWTGTRWPDFGEPDGRPKPQRKLGFQSTLPARAPRHTRHFPGSCKRRK